MPVPATPPVTPALYLPPNSGFTASSRPKLTWEETGWTNNYTIQIDNNSDFSSPIVNKTNILFFYTLETDLAVNTTYYWRVASNNAAGSSSYSPTWSFTYAIPDVNLTDASISNTTAPDASVMDSFGIQNTALGSLDYSIKVDYLDYIYPQTQNFNTELGWVASGELVWARNTGTSNLDGTPFAKIAASTNGSTGFEKNGTLTSPVFDASSCYKLYLQFDQYADFNESSGVVQYSINGGTNWTQIYNIVATTGAWSNPNHQKILIPNTSSTMMFRFTGTFQNRSGKSWNIDNIQIGGPQYNWFSFDSAVSGSILAAGSNTINITCSATGVPVGTYTANVTVTSNDPDEPNVVLPVEFIVANIVIPAVPANITTSIVSGDVYINWDDSANATSYDVYYSTDPYEIQPWSGVINVPTSEYTYTPTAVKMFFYIRAKNGTKSSAKSIIVK